MNRPPLRGGRSHPQRGKLPSSNEPPVAQLKHSKVLLAICRTSHRRTRRSSRSCTRWGIVPPLLHKLPKSHCPKCQTRPGNAGSLHGKENCSPTY